MDRRLLDKVCVYLLVIDPTIGISVLSFEHPFCESVGRVLGGVMDGKPRIRFGKEAVGLNLIMKFLPPKSKLVVIESLTSPPLFYVGG
jgi:hypothetical protein